MKNNPLIGENVFVVLHGASGSGKSTFAEWFEFMFEANHEFQIICADDFFMKDGEYQFDVTKLGQAHKWCFERARDHFACGTQTVVLANTNTEPSHYQKYIDMAKEFGYKVVSLVVQNLHGGENVHGVPIETLKRQKEKLINNLKL